MKDLNNEKTSIYYSSEPIISESVTVGDFTFGMYGDQDYDSNEDRETLT